MKIEGKDARVLGAIKSGSKTFGAIKERTTFNSDELEKILAILESSKQITSKTGRGILGQPKIYLYITEKGLEVVNEYTEYLRKKWQEIVNLASLGEREKLEQYMADHPFLVNNMLFYRIVTLPALSRLNLQFLVEGKHLCYTCKRELGRFTQKFTVKDCKKFHFKIPRGMTSRHELCANCFDKLTGTVI